ncbi:MAG TPA: proline dehydrogenase family protein [Actinomycetota bacterium]|nr:proline dehydrogenase family protein [Actinomycetota bacterium]
MPNHLLLKVAASDRVRGLVASSRLAKPVVDRFVAGDTLEDGLAAARELRTRGICAILDLLGEHVTDAAQADEATEAYLAALNATASEPALGAHVSVKLTQLGIDESFDQAVARLRRIVSALPENGHPLARVAIDMESHAYTDRTIEAYKAVRPESERLVLCLQASLRRTEADVEALLGLTPSIRLCKGAYDEPGELAYGHAETAASYRRLLAVLLPASPYTAVATHDEACIREALRLAQRRRIPRDRFEFQMLYGVRRDLQATLLDEGYAVRVYVPFGAAWYPYLMRRLAERPANLRLFLEAVVRG